MSLASLNLSPSKTVEINTMSNSPPLLDLSSLDKRSSTSALEPDFLGYTAQSWLDAKDRLGPVMQADINGRRQVLLCDHDANLSAWRTPDDWQYGPPTSSGIFFNEQMGVQHITQQDGPAHRRSRKLLLPSFGIGALAQHLDVLGETLTQGLASLDDTPVNLHEELCLLYTKGLSQTQVKHPTSDNSIRLLNRFEEEFISGLRLSRDDQRTWHQRPDYLKVKQEAFGIFEGIVSARLNGEVCDDTLQRLITPEKNRGFEPLNAAELVNAVYLLLVAGVGNIAILASGMLWQLSQSTEWQARLREELKDFTPAGLSGGVKNYPLLQAFILEAERCYLAAPITPKITTQDITLGGFDIAADTHVLQFIGLPHFDNQRYEDALRFNPDRWLLPNSQRANAYGGGTHLCLGMGVSRVLLPLTLAVMVRNHELTDAAQPKNVLLRPEVSCSPTTTLFPVTLTGRS